ncbi:MAG: DNA-binding CsgD family transcriptional regulator [Arenicella sp.]|jgi:DNA-binding CsgD family transcriptional regulator
MTINFRFALTITSFILLGGNSKAQTDLSLDEQITIAYSQADTATLIQNKVGYLQKIGLIALRSDHQKTLKISENILRISQNNGYPDGAVAAYNLNGMVFENQGKFDLAIEEYFKAKKIALFKENDLQAAYLDRNIGSCYQNMEDFDKAEESISKALDFFILAKDSAGMMATLNSLATLYGDTNNKKEAVETFTRCKAVAANLGDDYFMVVSDLGIANNSDFIEHYTEVKQKLLNCQMIFEKFGDLNGSAVALNNLGTVELENEHYSKAIEYLSKSLTKSDSLNFEILSLDNYRLLSECYRETGDFENAFNTLVEFQKLDSTINSRESKNEQLRVEIEYKVLENKLEIQQIQNKLYKATQEKKTSDFNFYLVLVISCSILILMILVIYGLLQKKSKNKILQALEREKLNNVISELRSKIAPQLEDTSYTSTDHDHTEILRHIDVDLTPREEEVLKELSFGKTNKEIASVLFLSTNTIKSHLLKIYEKLEVSNRTLAAQKFNEMKKN